ncbi:MAG: hypothetical protein Q7R96_01720 [Nanoarchaeota archaeon]|nr:hypothetical protein [Nanoarchaeota archaeon]
MEELTHECGIAAVVLKKPLDYYPTGGALHALWLMLNNQQHRGQESCGFYTYNPERNSALDGDKGPGLVNEFFRFNKPTEREQRLKDYAGTVAAGNIRYSTSGKPTTLRDLIEEAQPFYRRNGVPRLRFTIQWNGTLANDKELKKYLQETYGIKPETAVDTELLVHLLGQHLEQQHLNQHPADYLATLRNLEQRVDGGVSIILLNGEGHLFAYRKEPGIRPLCWGENEDYFAVASESCAFQPLNIKKVHTFKPGEALTYIDKPLFTQLGNAHIRHICFFEGNYFSKATSELDEVSIYRLRRGLGEQLAQEEPLREHLDDSYVVLPVPDTSLPAARAYAERLGLRCIEALIKNPHAGRTFIEKKEMRHLKMDLKFDCIYGEIEGKNILLVDDSVVRGSTTDHLVQFINRRFQPASIHPRSTTPPIRHPCFYGVDIPSRKELIAALYVDTTALEQHFVERFGVTSMHYLSLPGMLKVYEHYGIPAEQLCAACLTGDYPTPYGQQRAAEDLHDNHPI